MDNKNSEEFIRVAILDNNIEAQIVESILIDENIPHRMQSFHDTAFDGLFQVQKGWGVVYASSSRESEILEIIKNVRSGAQDEQISDEDL